LNTALFFATKQRALDDAGDDDEESDDNDFYSDDDVSELNSDEEDTRPLEGEAE
jgi:hypothetical protein